MANFFVRVELHDAGYADYQRLHTAMANANYSRVVNTTSGPYHLPTAEYVASFADNVTAIAVRDHVFAIAAAVKPAPWVLAVKSADFAIYSIKA